MRPGVLLSCVLVGLLAGILMSGLAWANSLGRYPYLSCFAVASRLHDVPLDMLLAVAATESNWNPDARSDANAHGIMQIQWPGTARHLGVKRVSELYNPCLNIELGARYLRQLIDDNGGDVDRGLAAYNYGPTRVANMRRLPAGARNYIETVNGHRDRILLDTKADAKADVHSNLRRAMDKGGAQRAGGLLRFDSATRARRYARSLGLRIGSADFAAERQSDGSFAVTMTVKAGGLSLADLTALDQLGWSGGM